jgi:predicted ATPase
MGLIERFHVKRMGVRRRDYEVLVKTRATCTDVSLTDVGFGVSQVLPVIAECFYAPPGSTIIIEQPEVHLHPSVQSSLADLFIDAIGASQDGKQRNIQLIVESHSEHFLRRLQLRIAQEKIAAGRTALYFCESESDGSRSVPLDVDPYGNILNWPRDFFGDPMTDLVEMNEATTRRKRRAATG